MSPNHSNKDYYWIAILIFVSLCLLLNCGYIGSKIKRAKDNRKTNAVERLEQPKQAVIL